MTEGERKRERERETAQNVDFCRKPQIFADSRLLLHLEKSNGGFSEGGFFK